MYIMNGQISYIDINRINASDRESDETSTWTVDLNKTLSLPAGTEISLQQTFINQQGILGSSIEIERDYEETINCHFYVTDQFHPIPDQIPKFLSNIGNQFLPSLFLKKANSLFSTSTPIEYVRSIYGSEALSPYRNLGGSATPLILYEVFNDDTADAKIQAVTLERSFTVKKGIYGINQLADIITDQINGKLTLSRNGEYVRTQPFKDLGARNVYRGDVSQDAGLSLSLNRSNEGVYNFDDINNGTKDLGDQAGDVKRFFVSNETHQTLVAIRTEFNTNAGYPLVDFNTANYSYAILVDNQRAKDTGTHGHGDPDETADEYVNVGDYQLGKIGYKIGSIDFNISYDTVNNGYTLSHLHQPYRPPTHDIMGNPIANSASEAVGIRNFKRELPDPFPNPAASTGAGVDKTNERAAAMSGVIRPYTRISGAIINNMAFKTCILKGNSTATPPSNKVSLFSEYFNTEGDARKAWSTTLWARMGFGYDQFNSQDHFENIRTYDRQAFRLMGVTTDAKVDASLQSSISTQINPCRSTPSLGSHGAGGTIRSVQTFGFHDMATPKNSAAAKYPDPKVSLYNNIDMFVGSLCSLQGTMIHVTTTDQPLIARNLPVLSVYGYYLISSDIVPQHDDIVGKGSPLPLLGIVPKSSLSNQDFIFTDNQIVHTLANPITLNKIRVSVLNPDLTLPELNENSSVIFKITQPPPIEIKKKE